MPISLIKKFFPLKIIDQISKSTLLTRTKHEEIIIAIKPAIENIGTIDNHFEN